MSRKRRSRGVQATAAGIEILEARRIGENWTRQGLANRAGVSLDTLERLIKRDKVDRESVRKIVYALNLQPTDIIAQAEWDGIAESLHLSKERFIPRILMSYHDADSAVAQQLCNQLKAMGQPVFTVGSTMRQSANWFQRFAEELNCCNGYVLLLSSQAIFSEMMTEEVRRVREHYDTKRQPQIIPIQLGHSVTHSDLDDYLVGLESWEWRSPTDTTAIVEMIHHQLTSTEQNQNYSLIEKEGTTVSTVILPTVSTEPELPVGQVPLDSPFYIERPPIEAQCYQESEHPGALIRIKAPRQMGKTSLMARILHQARERGCYTTHLSLQLATSEVLSNIDRLMRWFCLCVGRGLHLSNQLAEYWDEIFDGNYNSTVYFENYLLATMPNPVLIGLDEVDRVFAYPEVANDFFGLLRAWYEKAKYGDRDSEVWKKLRLIVIHSTEVYIPMNLNQSPFNVGLSIELPEFTQLQIRELAQRHCLDWSTTQVTQLEQLVGGHPYLVRVALYHVAHQNITLDQLLGQATTESGVYSDHLRRHLWNLEQYPELAIAFRKVVTANAPISLNSIHAFKLHSMGLVTIVNNLVKPRCDLYQQYFYRHLKDQ